MVELIEQSQKAVDDLVDVVGRATIEAVLKLSAQGVAGVPHPGKKGGAVGWHRGGAGDGLPAGAEATGEAATFAPEGSGAGWRGAAAGLRSDASGREAEPSDAGDSAAGGLDPPLRRRLAPDGGDGGGIEVQCESASCGGERGRIAAAVRASPGRSQAADPLRGRIAFRGAAGAGSGGGG